MNREELQVRTVASPFTTREENNQPIIEGKFISFTGSYEICQGGVEIISPNLEIEGDDFRALINHDSRLVLGRSKTGTLTLTRKNDGIYGKVLVNPNDQEAMNLYHRVQRGDVDQCSFGFWVLREKTEILPDDTVQWTIEKIRLIEVSVVTFPAYEDTSVSARERQIKEIKAEARKKKAAEILRKMRD